MVTHLSKKTVPDNAKKRRTIINLQGEIKYYYNMYINPVINYWYIINVVISNSLLEHIIFIYILFHTRFAEAGYKLVDFKMVAILNITKQVAPPY